MTDALIVIAIVASAAGYAALTAAIPVLAVGDPLGPRAFPTLIAIGMALSAALLLIEMWRARRAVRATPVPAAAGAGQPSITPAPCETQQVPLGRRGALVLLAVVALFGLYISVVETLGFVLASAAFLLACCTLLDSRRWLANLLVAAGVPLGLYLLLARMLMVPLPAGPLPF